MSEIIDAFVPVVAALGLFGMPVFIVWLALHFNNRKKELFHASLQKLIDSGQELSPELLQSIPGYVEDQPFNDIKFGAVLIGIGVGVFLLSFFGLHNSPVWASGLLVASLGLCLLGYGLYAKNGNRDAD